MKLVCLPSVNALVFARDLLLGKLADVHADEFVITIGGREREDPETLRQIKPLLQRVIRERIAGIEQELERYGVDVLG